MITESLDKLIMKEGLVKERNHYLLSRVPRTYSCICKHPTELGKDRLPKCVNKVSRYNEVSVIDIMVLLKKTNIRKYFITYLPMQIFWQDLISHFADDSTPPTLLQPT